MSCVRENLCVSPSNRLPVKSDKGLNTFGCLLNGESWAYNKVVAINRYERHLLSEYRPINDYLHIHAIRAFGHKCDTVKQRVTLDVIDLKSGNPKLLETKRLFTDLLGCDDYRVDSNSFNKVDFHHIDDDAGIFSGSFIVTVINDFCEDTILISNGIFDVKADIIY